MNLMSHLKYIYLLQNILKYITVIATIFLIDYVKLSVNVVKFVYLINKIF